MYQSVNLLGSASGRSLAEAGLAPAIKDSVNQVISDRFGFANYKVTMLAFPCATANVVNLLENCSHL